jgi:D-inositol-3-phosphate glycosyltransferase
MKIAMVSEHANPISLVQEQERRDLDRYLLELPAALARRGHEVTVYARRESTDQDGRVHLRENFVVENVPVGPPRPTSDDEALSHLKAFAAELIRRWRGNPPDLIHAHYWTSGLAALVAARDQTVPLVQTFHEHSAAIPEASPCEVGRTPTGQLDSAGRIRLERAIGHDCTRVVATSTEEVSQLLRLGIGRRGIRIVPCGVDIGRFAPELQPIPRGDRPRIVAVGGPTSDTGVDTVIEALAKVTDAELLVVGGPYRDQPVQAPECELLEKLAKTVGVADRVRFLERLAPDDRATLLRSADLVVAAPWQASCGFTVLEAMACGAPVVVSAVGSLADVVVDGSTGAHVPPGRVDLLALTLRRLLADPVRRQAYGIAGTDRVRARYRWERVACDLETVYEEALAFAQAA